MVGAKKYLLNMFIATFLTLNFISDDISLTIGPFSVKDPVCLKICPLYPAHKHGRVTQKVEKVFRFHPLQGDPLTQVSGYSLLISAKLLLLINTPLPNRLVD